MSGPSRRSGAPPRAGNSPGEAASEARFHGLVDPGIGGMLNDLCNEMVRMSGLIARIRRDGADASPFAVELAALDAAFDRSISLTRAMSEKLNAQGSEGEFVSICRVVRDVVHLIQPSLPEEVAIQVQCPERPVLAAARAAEVRWIVATLVGYAADLLSSERKLVVEVSAVSGARDGFLAAARVEVRCPVMIDPRNPAIEAMVRPTVNAIGGSFEIRFVEGKTTVFAVQFPCTANG